MADAQSRVELIVDAAKALNPLRRVKDQTRRLEDAVKNAQNNVRTFNRRIRETGKSSSTAANGIGNLARAVGKAAIAYATFSAAQAAVSASIQRIESERRIEFLARGYGEVAQLSQAAADASVRFGQSQTVANKALADVYARLRPVGVSLEDIVSTYNGFNTAARISGATAVEASNAFRQLAQALGSGALRGDEFNSISEQVPGILTAISQETGVAQGKLRAYAAEGKITADVVIGALRRIEKDGAEQLADALSGPEQKIRDFQNATEELQIALTETIIPDLTDSFRDLAQIILDLEGPIRFVGGLLANALGGARDFIGLFKSGTQGAEAAIKAGRLPLQDGGLFGRGEGAAKLFEGTITPFGVGIEAIKKEAYVLAETSSKTYVDAYIETMQKYLAASDKAKQLAAQFDMGLGGLKGGGIKTAPTKGKPSKEALELQKQLAQAAQNRIDIATEQRQIELDLEKSFQNQLDSIGSANALLQAKLDGNEQEVAYEQQIESLVNKYGEDKRAQIELLVNTNKELSQKVQLEQEAAVEAQRLQAIYDSLGSTIANGVVSMLDAAFDRTKSLADAAGNMLRNLANQLLQLGINTLLSSTGISLFQNLPGLAKGGTAMANQPYIVGEKGPELFVPGKTGTVVPNNAMGGIGNITVNVDAGGSNVQGDAAQAKALGAAIGAAVQSEILKQKKPGGLLY